jgi:hypothetical protein
MKLTQFPLMLLFWRHAAGSLENLRESFIEMKNDLPLRAIEDILHKQQELIQILQSYNILSENFQEGYYHGNETPFLTKKKKERFEPLDVDVHHDIIFVGFPGPAVESVRAKWFEPLTHEDPIMASIGKDSHIVVLPGDLKMAHHFHLPSISFHVADSIKEYITKLLLLPGENGESYINSWELEEILDDLSDVINRTHDLQWKITQGSDNSLFILNIDLNTPETEKRVKYVYRNGFSPKDMAVMVADREVILALEKVLDVTRSSRLDLPAADTKHSLVDFEPNDEYLERFALERCALDLDLDLNLLG